MVGNTHQRKSLVLLVHFMDWGREATCTKTHKWDMNLNVNQTFYPLDNTPSESGEKLLGLNIMGPWLIQFLQFKLEHLKHSFAFIYLGSISNVFI